MHKDNFGGWSAMKEVVVMSAARTPWWAWVWPTLAFAIMLLMMAVGASGVFAGLGTAVLIAAVFAAVYHAEVIAHRIGTVWHARPRRLGDRH